jgi:hypothetical protein
MHSLHRGAWAELPALGSSFLQEPAVHVRDYPEHLLRRPFMSDAFSTSKLKISSLASFNVYLLHFSSPLRYLLLWLSNTNSIWTRQHLYAQLSFPDVEQPPRARNDRTGHPDLGSCIPTSGEDAVALSDCPPTSQLSYNT